MFVRSVLAVLAAFTMSVSAHAQSYEYDERGRLIRVSYPDCTLVTYVYDAAGNRTHRIVSLNTTQCAGNAAPVWSSGTSLSVSENAQVTGYVASATDAEGATVSYAIVGGTDAGRFSINAATGVLSFLSAPNFEAPSDLNGDNVYGVVLQASDGVLTSDHTVSISVTNLNDEVPVWSSGTSISVAEGNAATGYIARATDADSATLTYSVVGGSDQARFSINASSGALSFVSAPNYEAPADQNGDNAYVVTLRASDGALSRDRTVTVSVSNVNDQAPVWSSGTSATAYENGTDAGYTVRASDPDGQAITYSIAGGPDAARFRLNGTRLSFVSAPDYEAPSDANADNTYVVILRADDATQHAYRTVSVRVINRQDVAPVWSSGTSATAYENGTHAGYTVRASDPDGQAITYSVAGGPDAARFRLNGTRLNFVSAPDYEAPSDANADNTYIVILRADDATQHADRTVSVRVINRQDVVPVWSSGTSASVVENTPGWHYAARASDPDGQAITFSIVGGADAARFSMSSNRLQFVSTPDFEAPSDANADNTYIVTLRADDGTQRADHTVSIQVTDDVSDNPPPNQPPVANDYERNTRIGETTGIAVMANDSDPDGDYLTITRVMNVTQGTVTIASNGRSLFYTPNNQVLRTTFQYEITDGRGGFAIATVHIRHMNAIPVANADVFTVVAGSTTDLNVLGNDTDADGDPLYLVSVSGVTGGGSVSRYGHTARFVAPSSPGTSTFTYTMWDEGRGGMNTATVTVTTTPSNQPPVAVADSYTMDVNGLITLNVLANDSDPDGDPLTITAVHSVTGAAGYTIASDGQSISYGAPATEGTYSLVYEVSDGRGGRRDGVVTISVLDSGCGTNFCLPEF